MELSNNLLALVKHYESLHDGDLRQIGLQPKMCPALYWTEGYGKVIVVNGQMLKGEKNKALAYKLATIYTEADAIAALKKDLAPRIKDVRSLGLSLLQHQEDALVSFVYNVGFSALQRSSLLKLIKLKAPASEIDKAFRMWNKGGGKVLKGLDYRRTTEALLFIKNELKFFN